MKHVHQIILLGTFLCAFSFSNAQTSSSFEEFILAPNSYYNGSDFKGDFKSGSAWFDNVYDTTFGPYWEGFAVSDIKDDTTHGYGNQYSAVTGGGLNKSNNYGVFYMDGTVRLTGDALGKTVNGFFITNSTYAYFDMVEGSQFSKKFGGTSGNDPDYFRVLINAWKPGGLPADTSLMVYLADFRDVDNSKDFILDSWKWVDLRPFGVVDSFSYIIQSSDTGAFGINTPLYFCIDVFNTTFEGLPNYTYTPGLKVYPNPSSQFVNIISEMSFQNISIIDMNGKEVIRSTESKIDISELPLGIYCVRVEGESGISQQKIVKE